MDRGGLAIRGEALGDGSAIVLAHGLTATRAVVVHGSKLLPREGFRLLSADARGHGESDGAPPGAGYSYAELAADLGAVVATAGDGGVVLAGHSMGAHTIAHRVVESGTDGIAGVVFIGPANTGSPPEAGSLDYWDALADGLETGGVGGWLAAYDHGLNPAWRETLLRIARARMERHRHPEAVARALREVPRSVPFAGLEVLESLEVPALVVASHDDADPGHPYDVAAEWAERLPQARLVSEAPGESPLAWQGGRLSREIAAFCAEDAVSARR